MMDGPILALFGFVLLFVLMAVRVPIGFAMALVGILGFGAVTSPEAAIRLLSQSSLTQVTANNLSVIPMFILMGAFTTAAGMSRELFRAAHAWFGHLPGGLAMATVAACGGFAAINGSSVATAATMSSVALPEMRRAGYEPGTSAGVIAAGGTLGLMIPPSVIFIIYGILTDTDIGQLFIAGIVPGLLGIVLYCVTIQVIVWFRPQVFPKAHKEKWSQRWLSLRDVWVTVLLFIMVVGAIYGGLCTTTEAAGIGATGALVIGVLRGRLPPKKIYEALTNALSITAAIFVIVIGAYLFGYFLTITGATQMLVDLLVTLPMGPYGVLALVLAGYLVLGAVMDELAVILLTVPIIAPVIVGLGFDPVWFGVIIVMTVCLGMITPPVGMNVFVIKSVAADISLGAIYRGVSPFILVDFLRLFLLSAFPLLSLYLVQTMH